MKAGEQVSRLDIYL